MGAMGDDSNKYWMIPLFLTARAVAIVVGAPIRAVAHSARAVKRVGKNLWIKNSNAKR